MPKTVDRVNYLLQSKPYTAIREIGLMGEQALVITTLRKDPTANPLNDTLPLMVFRFTMVRLRSYLTGLT